MTATLLGAIDRPVQLTLDLRTATVRVSHARKVRPYWQHIHNADVGGELHAKAPGVRAVLSAERQADGLWVGVPRRAARSERQQWSDTAAREPCRRLGQRRLPADEALRGRAGAGRLWAQVALASARILDGSLPPRALRLVREWTRLHRDELAADWQRAQQRVALEPIPPLP